MIDYIDKRLSTLVGRLFRRYTVFETDAQKKSRDDASAWREARASLGEFSKRRREFFKEETLVVGESIEKRLEPRVRV